MNLTKLMTASQAARRLAVSSARIQQLRQSGKLPATRTPLGFLYQRSDVEALVTAKKAHFCSAPKEE